MSALCLPTASAAQHATLHASALPTSHASRSDDRTDGPALTKGQATMKKFFAALLRSLSSWSV
jgi:hypothetical protein